jgi:hypothetical protein
MRVCTRTPVVVAALCAALCLSSLSRGGAQNAPGANGADEKRFLVIAPERFHAALRDYIRYKKAQMPTDLISLEKALRTSPGVDDPERLKRCLYAAWKRRHVGYALLVGDADVLPVRYMVLDRVTPAAFDYAFYPSDLYYSDLADSSGQFDDWYPPSIFFQGMKFLLFGDPTLPLPATAGKPERPADAR